MLELGGVDCASVKIEVRQSEKKKKKKKKNAVIWLGIVKILEDMSANKLSQGMKDHNTYVYISGELISG